MWSNWARRSRCKGLPSRRVSRDQHKIGRTLATIDTPEFGRAATAAPHALAAQAGRDILADGGNAIEAMVAMAATIAVVYPFANGIGGDGFWLVRTPAGVVHYIEACGYAGEGALAARYRELGDTIPTRGPLAALTVPGAVDGWRIALELARSLGGKRPLDVLVHDAVRHAREGCPISRSEARFAPIKGDTLLDAPGFRATFYPGGKPPAAATRRTLPALAATLQQLAHAGLDDFYRGDIGREIAADLEKIGSPVTRADLRGYEARTRQPLSLRSADHTLYNSPPPTQGLASLLILGIYERLGIRQAETFAHVHGLIEATKRAFAIRDRVCTDFDRLMHAPADFLTPEALGREAAAIDMRRAAPFPLPPGDGGTVWMGAIDASGLAVSYIQSVYWEYGSGCVLPKTGIVMQNRGSSMSLGEGSVNPLEPGRRPFHTLNPAMAVFSDGRVLAYGSMGGDGQPQFQAQVFTRIAAGEALGPAIDAPRFLLGRTWGAAETGLALEDRFDSEIASDLEKAGHPVIYDKDHYSDRFGHAGALMHHPGGRIAAAHDPRSDGGADGF